MTAIEFVCNLDSGFVMPPARPAQVGWVTALNGFGLPPGSFKNDLTVSNPLTGGQMPVAGVLAQFIWAGGTSDPLQLEFYVSKENATQIRMARETVLNTLVSALNFSIVNFDQENKAWFTALAPEQQLSGILVPQTNPVLNVGTTPVSVSGVNVYQIFAEIGPSGNGVYSLKLETSPTVSSIKAWGVLISSPPTA